jgi:hypothetical protein
MLLCAESQINRQHRLPGLELLLGIGGYLSKLAETEHHLDLVFWE